MKKSKKNVNLEIIEDYAKRIYELASEISLLQEELEDMLTVMNNNFLDFKNGKISKEFFKSNEKKLKTQTLSIINKINRTVDASLRSTDKINEEIKSQGIKVG